MRKGTYRARVLPGAPGNFVLHLYHDHMLSGGNLAFEATSRHGRSKSGIGVTMTRTIQGGVPDLTACLRSR